MYKLIVLFYTKGYEGGMEMIDVKQLAIFIATLNKEEAHNVGYCGDEANEIENTLYHEFSDYPIERSFTVLYEGEVIVGALGFDVDEEDKSAEVWGPFIQGENWLDTAKELWETGLAKLESTVHSFYGFYNVKHTYAESFMTYVQGVKKGAHSILKMEAKQFREHKSESIEKMSPYYHEQFMQLHDKAFPGTYYNGKAILERSDDEHQLFCYVKDNSLLGYIYIEGKRKFREGNVEYIAVAPHARQKGIGKDLLNYGLYELFHHIGAEEISLCVGCENNEAIQLYKKVGFSVESELNYYITNIKKE